MADRTKFIKLIDSMRMFRVVKTAVIFFVAISVVSRRWLASWRTAFLLHDAYA